MARCSGSDQNWRKEAKLMTRTDEEKLIETLIEFAKAYREKNLAGILKLFTGDAEVTSAEGVLYQGAQDQIRERYVKEFNMS